PQTLSESILQTNKSMRTVVKNLDCRTEANGRTRRKFSYRTCTDDYHFSWADAGDPTEKRSTSLRTRK
ncbi:MAG TPA: hypothetical protein DD635_04305, partial [Flavobacteriales bacterium]|nr:hypothetical protein [Flavobacteriales bacterium]